MLEKLDAPKMKVSGWRPVVIKQQLLQQTVYIKSTVNQSDI